MIALKDLMDHFAGRLKGAGHKNVYAYPTSPVQTPGIVVGYPTDIDYDLTFDNGAMEFEFPIFFLVGKNLTEAARDQLSDMIAGSLGVKRTLEEHPMTKTSVQVVDVKIETISVAGIEYLSATFLVNVIATNS